MTKIIQTKYRRITTEIPNPADLEIIRKLDLLEPLSSHQNLPIVVDNAEDFRIFDRHGNIFLDFSSGIFVTNSGHSNPYIIKNIRKQLDYTIYSYSFPTEMKLKFLSYLTIFTNFDKAFLLSSGTEATEAAVKIIRLASNKKIIISFNQSMHGKTCIGENLRGDFDWVTKDENIKHLNFPDNDNCKFKEDIANLIRDESLDVNMIAGFVIESYRGWNAQFYPIRYIQDLIKWAKENNDILVCFDEIQGGFGRSGKLFSYQWYNDNNFVIEPDLVCIGKALGCGLPISAVLGKKGLFDKAEEKCFDFSSTYSGNPLVCSAGFANLEYIEKNHLIEEANRKGIILEKIKNFEKYDIVKKINTKGLIGAIIFKNKEIANEICLRCLKNGLILVKTGRESIKIGPPLTIPDMALREGIYIIEDTIKNENSIITNNEN